MKSHKKVFPKKSLGQNFLINTGLQYKIVETCQLRKFDYVLEVGPGTGALTRLIAPCVKQVIAVEKDKELAAKLKEEFNGSNVEIVCADILEFNFDKLVAPTKLIGNLPYNIATPILEKVILSRQIFQDCFVMVQLEHGKRMVASIRSKDYGSLSCFVQLYMNPKILFKISPGSFNPAPKVFSCFMQITPLSKTRFEVVDEKGLFEFIKMGFGQRRKILLNALKNFVSEDLLKPVLEKLHIDLNVRAEELKLEDFVRITNLLKQNK